MVFKEKKIKKKKHLKGVVPLWKAISKIAKITKNQVKRLHSGVAYLFLFLKFTGKEVCVLTILVAKYLFDASGESKDVGMKTSS